MAQIGRTLLVFDAAFTHGPGVAQTVNAPQSRALRIGLAYLYSGQFRTYAFQAEIGRALIVRGAWLSDRIQITDAVFAISGGALLIGIARSADAVPAEVRCACRILGTRLPVWQFRTRTFPALIAGALAVGSACRADSVLTEIGGTLCVSSTGIACTLQYADTCIAFTALTFPVRLARVAGAVFAQVAHACIVLGA